MIIFILLCFSVRICIDPSFVFKYYKEYQDHCQEIELIERVEKDEKVEDYLTSWLYKYQADRIFIIQYHNGTKDWQHGTMRFEKCLHNTIPMKSDYVNFNLTWLDMPFYLKEYDYFIGNIYELKNIDPVLYNQLIVYDIDYLACKLIKNEHGESIGILGVTYSQIDIDINIRHDKIHDYLLEDSKIIYEYIK